MTTFKYRAQAADGSTVTGVVEAYDEYEAVDQLRGTYPIVEAITEIKGKRKINIDLNEPLWVEDKSLSLVASQFAIMLKAGLPMNRVVELIAGQTTDKLLKRILTACAADVSAGYSLARSLEKNGKKIPAVFIESVRAGEESGTVEASFESLKIYYEKAHKLKSKVKGALTYPVILLILAAVVIAIVMVVLVPRMTSMLTGMGTDLPLPTRMLMAISGFFQRGWPFMLAGLAALVFGFIAYNRTESGKIRLSDLRMKLPVLGRIARMNTAAQFANTTATLLGAGLPVNRVMTILSRVLDMRCVGVELARRVTLLESGRNLADVLSEIKYLPSMLVEMARVGENSGSLESTLRTIGEFYDSEAERASDKALSLMEPTITIIMGVVIGFIVIAIYMPIFSMSASTGAF